MAFDWGQAAQGFIGAGPIGGIIGGFGGTGASKGQDAYTGRLSELEKMYGGRAKADVERSGLSDFRGNQQGLVSQLELMAQGQGPSVAQANFEAATDRNTKQQQALAAGATGPNAALAQFQASQGASMTGAQAAQDLVGARMGEQQAAIGQLGQVLSGARGQDEYNSQFNANQGNQMEQFQRQLNDQSQLSALGMQGQTINQVAGQPGMGERILSGAAGMAGMALGQGAGGGGGAPQQQFQMPQQQSNSSAYNPMQWWQAQ